LETRCGSLVAVRINLVGLVNRKQSTRLVIRNKHQGCVVILSVHMAVVDPAECDTNRDRVVFGVTQMVTNEGPVMRKQGAQSPANARDLALVPMR
jgi:hypothetical protein